MNHHTPTPLESSLKPRPLTAGDDQGFGIEEVTARVLSHWRSSSLLVYAERFD